MMSAKEAGAFVPSKKKSIIRLFWQRPWPMLAESGAVILGVATGAAFAFYPALTGAIGANILLSVAALAGGFFLLTRTSDTVVHNASVLGRQAGISALVLGVALGLLTSLPELFVSAGAALAGSPGIGIGNIVGSNIANILLILAGTAVIRTISTKDKGWMFDMLVMGFATLVFGAQLAAGKLYPAVGVLLLATLVYYVMKMFRSVRATENERAQRRKAVAVLGAVSRTEAQKGRPARGLPPWLVVLFLLAGVAGLVGSAGFTVQAAIACGTAFGISPSVVGVLAVAVGTSLPELMVNFKSALKGATQLAIGNVLGSNVFNLVLIGGLLSLTGAAVPADLDPFEGAPGLVNMIAFGGAAFLAWLVMVIGRRGIRRVHGIIGLALYAIYTVAVFILGRI